MRFGVITRVILSVGVVAAVYTLGAWLGSIHGKYRVETAQREQRQSLQRYLDRRLKQIEVGQPFPHLPLVPAGGGQSEDVRRLLPQGGILFYFASECPACLDAVTALDSALSGSSTEPKSTVLATGPNAEYLTRGMQERGITRGLYSDTGDVLRSEYDMILARTFFILDSAGILIEMGPIDTNHDVYASILYH